MVANSNQANAKKAKMRATILGITYSVVVNGILPIIIFQLLKSYTTLSDFWALVLSGVPPILDTIIGVARKGQVDIIAGIALVSIVVNILLIVFGGSPRLLLIACDMQCCIGRGKKSSCVTDRNSNSGFANIKCHQSRHVLLLSFLA